MYSKLFKKYSNHKASVSKQVNENVESLFLSMNLPNKNNDLVTYLCYINSKTVLSGAKLTIYGFDQSTSSTNNLPENFCNIDFALRLSYRDTPIEILRIYAGLKKRVGRGSSLLHFLENYVVPQINTILFKNNLNTAVGYIFGISADISTDTDKLARAKFYSKNGYSMINYKFYKYM